MTKITLSVIVYGPCLNKTTTKTNKKQMIGSANNLFLNNPLSTCVELGFAESLITALCLIS